MSPAAFHGPELLLIEVGAARTVLGPATPEEIRRADGAAARCGKGRAGGEGIIEARGRRCYVAPAAGRLTYGARLGW